MRRVRYSVAMSLDGFIAGPNGESDWIVIDPEIDFGSIMGEFDTLLLGRKTWEASQGQGGGTMPGFEVIVCSRTLKQADCQNAMVSNDPARTLEEIRERPGRDIWLFGGGDLFRSLLALGLVDSVEVAVMPVLLGSGRPLLSSPEGSMQQTGLKLVKHRLYPATGTLSLEYSVEMRKL